MLLKGEQRCCIWKALYRHGVLSLPTSSCTAKFFFMLCCPSILQYGLSNGVTGTPHMQHVDGLHLTPSQTGLSHA